MVERQPRFLTQRLSGWGRFPVETCHLFRPERHSELRHLLTSRSQTSYISRGLGRSYGDAALNKDSGVISHLRLNRFLSFDEASGVLECEGGISFAEILTYFLPRGFFLPVTPGTKFITVGGAIASDIHGKDHHRSGTIANFVLELQLLTASGDILTCSANSNGEFFWATVGGMGLTGVILSARLQLRPVESAYLVVDYHEARNLDEALGLLAASEDNHQYSVAWLDCLAGSNALGRGVIMTGNHAAGTEIPPQLQCRLAIPHRRSRQVPFDVPSGLLNRLSVGAYNKLYFHRHRRKKCDLVDAEAFFFPLDGIHHWNRLYGRRGLVQYQFAVPASTSRRALLEVLERLGRSRPPVFLAVLKQLGQEGQGLLSFPMRGHTLALDFPRVKGLDSLLDELDRLVLRYGGRVYLAKDATLKPHTFAGMYPRLDKFLATKRTLDPNFLFASSLSRRLGILGK